MCYYIIKYCNKLESLLCNWNVFKVNITYLDSSLHNIITKYKILHFNCDWQSPCRYYNCIEILMERRAELWFSPPISVDCISFCTL